MKPMPASKLEALMPGLPFRNNEFFCELVRVLPEGMPSDRLHAILMQAVDRIESQMAAPLYRVVTCNLTRPSDPSQWDGSVIVEGGDGAEVSFFIRFLQGSLKLYIDDILVEFQVVADAPCPNTITLERVAALLSRIMYFPDLSLGKLSVMK